MSNTESSTMARALLLSALSGLICLIGIYALYFSGAVDERVGWAHTALHRALPITYSSAAVLLAMSPNVVALCVAGVVFIVARRRQRGRGFEVEPRTSNAGHSASTAEQPEAAGSRSYRGSPKPQRGAASRSPGQRPG